MIDISELVTSGLSTVNKYTAYASNPIYMATINFIFMCLIYVGYANKITIGLIIISIILSYGMFFTFSYSYKSTIKPTTTSQLLIPQTQNDIIPRNTNIQLLPDVIAN